MRIIFDYFTYILFVSIIWCCNYNNEQEEIRPNILFIFTDDQSHRTVSAYKDEGSWPWVYTPNIDKLAVEGVRFTSAYGASWCSPSRACVLTGRLPHGIRGMNLNEKRDSINKWECYGDCYDKDEVNFWPAILKNSGYETAFIGKWHLGQNAGHNWLWDYSVVWDQNKAEGDRYNNQALAINGNNPIHVPGYSTDVYTQYAENFIEGEHVKPWILWLCYNAPHNPQTIHTRDSILYEGSQVVLPSDIFGPRPDKPRYMHDLTQLSRNDNGDIIWKNKLLSTAIIDYNRLVNPVDKGLGKLLAKLKETSQLENTVIIFSSDQGYAWGEHGFAMKAAPYDACLRIPLIIRMPGQMAKNKICKQPVSVVDLAPTILSFAKLENPWKMHGRDLSKLLFDPDNIYNWPVLMEHFYSRFGTETNVGRTGTDYVRGVPYWLFLRHGTYKYIRSLVPNEVEELYDLESDPEELVNLALLESSNTILNNFREKMEHELKRTDAGFIESMPPIDKINR